MTNKLIATEAYQKALSKLTKLKTSNKNKNKKSSLQFIVYNILTFLIKGTFLLVFSMRIINRMGLGSFTVTTNQFVLIKQYTHGNKEKKNKKQFRIA